MSSPKKTKDYDMFKKHESNRSIDQSNVERIKASISTRNLLEFRPIIVDENMRIIDGQHRLEAAKQLGVEIWYQIDEKAESEDILLLNINQKVWTVDSYLHYYISKGNQNYIEFKRFIEKEDIDLRQGVRLLLSTSPEAHAKFRSGSFVFPDEKKLAEIKEILWKHNQILGMIKQRKVDGANICRSRNLKSAIIELLKNKSVIFETFCSKLDMNMEKVNKSSSLSGSYQMFKEIYNWKNRDPLQE